MVLVDGLMRPQLKQLDAKMAAASIEISTDLSICRPKQRNNKWSLNVIDLSQTFQCVFLLTFFEKGMLSAPII